MTRRLATALAPMLVGLAALAGASIVAAADDPDIEVHRTDNGADIPDGGTFAMGTTSVGVPFTQYIAVGNTTGLLAISSIDVPVGFTMVQSPPSSIAGGASHGLHLRCDAASEGVFSGAVVIHSDDPDEDPFEVNVNCTVVAAGTPTIRLATDPGVAVADGGTLTLAPGTGVLMRVYNDQGGTGPLVLAPATIAPAGAIVGAYIPDDVVSVNGASTYFNVRCATALSSAGTPVTGTFEVSVGNNAGGSFNPYTFTLECTADISEPDPDPTDPPATDPSTTSAAGGRGLPSTGGAATTAWWAAALLVAGVLAARAAARRPGGRLSGR